MKKVFCLFLIFILLLNCILKVCNYTYAFDNTKNEKSNENDTQENYITITDKDLNTQKEVIKEIQYEKSTNITSTKGYIPNEINPCTVFGDDTRKGITNTSFPFSTICYLQITSKDGVASHATGFMIDSNVCMTVAHAVKNAQSIKVIPGKNADSEPFGSTWATNVVTSTSFNPNDDSIKRLKHDWAVLKLSDRIGNNCGWMALRNTSALDILNNSVGCSGYDDAKKWKAQTCGYGKITFSYSNYFYHNVDIGPGDSGAPVFLKSDNSVVGIQSQENSNVNLACKICDENFSVAKRIIDED